MHWLPCQGVHVGFFPTQNRIVMQGPELLHTDLPEAREVIDLAWVNISHVFGKDLETFSAQIFPDKGDVALANIRHMGQNASPTNDLDFEMRPMAAVLQDRIDEE